jgi:hypothetical protein
MRNEIVEMLSKMGNLTESFEGYKNKEIALSFAFDGDGEGKVVAQRDDAGGAQVDGFKHKKTSVIYFNKDNYKELKPIGLRIEEIAKEVEAIAHKREHG